MKRILCVVMTALLLCGCGAAAGQPETAAPKPGHGEKTETPARESAETPKSTDTTPQLLAMVESEEAARELAELYGIELVRFSRGLASFRTEEDPAAVIRRGSENGWPELSINRRNELY